MAPFTVIGIALGLAMDAFAVSIASSIALGAVSRRQIFRMAFHFGLFQALMPAIGWFLGSTVRTWIAAWDHWAAFGLLAAIGLKAVYEALTRDPETEMADPTRGMRLLALSLATSIDAMAVGFSLAALDVAILYPALVIGLITAGLSVVGMLFGARLGAQMGAQVGTRVEVAGGVLLIIIGVRILVEHWT